VPVFNVYIDEAGDEGFVFNEQPPLGSSRWFIVAGVIVKQDNDLEVSRCIDDIRQGLGWAARFGARPKPLHWRHLNHAQKLMVSGKLGQEPITSIHVCIWKEQIRTQSALRKSGYLYHYSLRLLLERASWFVHDSKGTMKVTLSNRAHFKLTDLQSYVRLLQGSVNFQGRPVFGPDDLTVTRPDLRKMLQVADAFASATLDAFDPNQFGDTEPRYLERLKDCLYRHVASGRLPSYGLKVFPGDPATCRLALEQHQWLEEFLGGK
jgi:hypothetical protein